jgi:hypothetical protein
MYLPKIMLASASIQLVMCLWYTLFLRKAGAGDESHFIAALEMIRTQGWESATRFGISIPYLLLALPLQLFIPSYLALRIVNLLLLFIFIWYVYNKIRIQHTFTLSILISYIATSSFYLFGTNDALLSITLGIFFTETYFLIRDRFFANPTWALVSLCVAFFTRELFLIYLPMVLLTLFIAWKHRALTRKSLYITGVFSLFMILLNGYALKHNQRLSYDNKIAPPGLSWTQLTYLSQLEANAGRRPEGQYVSWDELRTYLDTHGEGSLPNSIGESIFFDLRFTLSESVKNMKSSIISLIRQLGLLLIFPFLTFFMFTYKHDRIRQGYLIALLWGILCIFCLIIIATVELRWLAAIVLTYLTTSYDYTNESYVAEERRPLFSAFVLCMQLVFVFLSVFGVATYSKLIL